LIDGRIEILGCLNLEILILTSGESSEVGVG
jgi:hypothetical protein